MPTFLCYLFKRSLFKATGYNGWKIIPINEQIGNYKVHSMQNDSGCVAGVAVSLSCLRKLVMLKNWYSSICLLFM